MKGTIVVCLKELVVAQFGQDKWEQSLEDAGVSKHTIFTALADVDDAAVMKVIGLVCKVCNITPLQAADAFGDHWVNVYSQKLYAPYYKKHTTARDFLLAMHDLHVKMTQTVRNAKPPRFDYEWKDDKTLIMHYKSPRGLIDILVGLIKGVGKFYNEELAVSKIGSERVQIVFA